MKEDQEEKKQQRSRKSSSNPLGTNKNSERSIWLSINNFIYIFIK